MLRSNVPGVRSQEKSIPGPSQSFDKGHEGKGVLSVSKGSTEEVEKVVLSNNGAGWLTNPFSERVAGTSRGN